MTSISGMTKCYMMTSISGMTSHEWKTVNIRVQDDMFVLLLCGY